MKYLIVLLLLASCDRVDRNVITSKRPYDFFEKPMPKGLCEFTVGSGNESLHFVDSCHFYHMLDTIKSQ